ncbi:MAG: hypothetical protein PWP11_875 [Thauera sp.]|nr:hypothetical protein [Thauera sp.]MDI3489598.1 hypothetical protein [Thauera sp.]
MDKSLFITQTRDRHGKPLCVVENMPGWGAELYPEKMRAIAKALTTAADMAESGAADHGKRTFEHIF